MKKLVKKGNGQSLVVKYEERASFYLDERNTFFVIDIDGYSVSKQALSMWNTARASLDSIIYDIGFHLGGHCQSDLPEQILLCTQINIIRMPLFVCVYLPDLINPLFVCAIAFVFECDLLSIICSKYYSAFGAVSSVI